MVRPTALALALAFCAAPHAEAALRVVTSTSDFGALASAIGGDKVAVTVLAKPTDNPHAVEVKTGGDALSRADVLIYAGADLDSGWVNPLVEASRNPKIAPGAPGRIEGRMGIELIDEPESYQGLTSEQHPFGNPHFMINPLAARKFAEGITDVFCRLDAPSCDTYRANLDAFGDRFDKSLRNWMRLLGPYRGNAVIVSLHPSWNYFANRFGLRLQDPDKPSAANVRTVVLVEPYQSRSAAESVAARSGGTVVDVCQFPGCMPGTQNDYIALIDADVNAIVAGFKAAKK